MSAAESAGEARPFNFDAMSVEQIQFLGRTILLGGDRNHERGESYDASTELEQAYQAEMERLLEDRPDVVKTVIKRAALSTDDYDKWNAACCAKPLAKVDYPLARAALLYVTHTGGESSESAILISSTIEDSMPEVAANLSDEIQAVIDHGMDGIPARLLD